MSKPIKTELDPDGLIRTVVGEWAEEKHERLRKYVDITRAVRKKFLAYSEATYIELFCGTSKSRIKKTQDVIDGSPVVAYRESVNGGSPFTTVHIADAEETFLAASKTRLEKLGAPVCEYNGYAENTIDSIINNLEPNGYHLAFLDPYNLKALPFSIIKKLSKLNHIDMLIHVSIMDMQLNLRSYIESESCSLDVFTPRWRENIDINAKDELIRNQILNHWLKLIKEQNMSAAEGIERVSGGNNQNLYWLVLVSRDKLAHKFWEAIRNVSFQRPLF